MIPPSPSSLKPSLWFVLLASALTVFAVWGAAAVPFHPDESTALYMSADFEAWWGRPLSLAWASGQPVNLRTHYRLLDAPLSRHILGLARTLRGLPAPQQDWRWDQNWEWNRAAGALPVPNLLMTARLANTLLLPFSLLFLYISGRILGGEAVGLAAALLLGLNPLILLHTRRAMSEAALILGVCFTLWAIVSGRRPWLVGLSLALAFNAKQSAIALLPVGLLAAAWASKEGMQGDHISQNARLGRLLLNAVQVLGIFALVTAALNPVYWRQPLPALKEALSRRQTLAAEQAADVARLAPEKGLESYTERAAAMLINLYMAPPAFAEYGNYTVQTAAAEITYLSMPFHHLLRGIAGGAAMLGLTLLGLALSIFDFRRAIPFRQGAMALAWAATAAIAVGLVLFFPISWQRYILPLIPPVCLWAAYPAGLIEQVKNKKRQINPAPNSGGQS